MWEAPEGTAGGLMLTKGPKVKQMRGFPDG